MSQFLTWEAIEAVERGAYRVLLYGPPGTGKTRSAFEAARALGKSLYNITLTDETPAAELRGHFVPQGDKWLFMYGPATRAFVEGAVLCLDEIDKASQDCLDFLHGLLNDPEVARLTLPNGEIVTPGSGFQVIATMNGELGDLQPSLQDRFSIAIEVTEPHPNAIASLPMDLQGAARNFESYDSSQRPSTIRRWSAFASLRDAPGVGVEIAAKAIFAHRAKELIDAYGFRSYMPPAPDVNSLESMSKNALVKEAVSRGIAKSGTKAQLIWRINTFDSKAAAASPVVEDEEVEDDEEYEEYVEPCSCSECKNDRARAWARFNFDKEPEADDDYWYCPDCEGEHETEEEALHCCYHDSDWIVYCRENHRDPVL